MQGKQPDAGGWSSSGVGDEVAEKIHPRATAVAGTPSRAVVRAPALVAAKEFECKCMDPRAAGERWSASPLHYWYRCCSSQRQAQVVCRGKAIPLVSSVLVSVGLAKGFP